MLAGHEAWMKRTRNACNILVGKGLEKQPLGELSKQEVNIMTNMQVGK
jgi:hypothetical protein